MAKTNTTSPATTTTTTEVTAATDAAAAADAKGAAAVDTAAADRAALLAELGALRDDGTLLPDPKPTEGDASAKAVETDAESTAEATSETDGEGEDEPDAESTAEDEPDAEAEKKAEADPVAARRIAQIQSEEKRAKQAIQAERAEIARERQQVEQALRAVEEFKALGARAKRDPVGVLQALGMTPDDFEDAAKILYGHSTAAQKNPKLREEAARLARERGTIGEVNELRAQLAKIEEREQQREQQVQQERAVTAYVGQVRAAVNGQAPLLSRLIAKNEARARDEIVMVAREMLEQTGDAPAPADVVTEIERRQTALLADLGIDAPAGGKKPATKSTPTPADKSRQATATATDTKKPPVTELAPTDSREEILKGWPA